MRALRAVQINVVLVMSSFAAIAWACLWDSDTLRHEARGMPGVVEAVTGFFPVYPDAYYERRIEIARERLAESPDRLEAYDDIAVSLDRLGDSAGAIEALLPKLAVIERYGSEAGNHLYRYHANIGTFYAHKWVRAGADGTDMADMERAREHIARAIELNPDAHFGREYVQLAAIEWLLDPEAGQESARWGSYYPTLASKFLTSDELRAFETELPQEAVDGLVGLIVLGNAWESVDVMMAIGVLMRQGMHSSIAAICGMRVDELIDDGKASLHPSAYRADEARQPDGEVLAEVVVDIEDVRDYYDESRQAAEAYRKQYSEFVRGKLEQGMHPDTHADFFVGVPAAVLPKMPNGFMGYGGYERTSLVILLVVVSCLLGIIALVGGAYLVVKRMRSRRSAKGSESAA